MYINNIIYIYIYLFIYPLARNLLLRLMLQCIQLTFPLPSILCARYSCHCLIRLELFRQLVLKHQIS
jgi:hypothetical protein